jgi:hypothetical protein
VSGAHPRRKTASATRLRIASQTTDENDGQSQLDPIDLSQASEVTTRCHRLGPAKRNQDEGKAAEGTGGDARKLASRTWIRPGSSRVTFRVRQAYYGRDHQRRTRGRSGRRSALSPAWASSKVTVITWCAAFDEGDEAGVLDGRAAAHGRRASGHADLDGGDAADAEPCPRGCVCVRPAGRAKAM